MAKKDYRTGYGKPPRETRFKKGQSGNPRGRPKGTRNLATDLKEELEELIVVSEDGNPRKMSKQRALVKTMTAKGLRGDMRAASAVISLTLTLDQKEGTGLQEEVLSEDDKEVLAAYEARLLGRQEPEGD